MTQSVSVRPQWQQEIALSYTNTKELAQALALDSLWVKQHESAASLFPLRVPRHFVSLMQAGNPDDPLLKQVMPQSEEFLEASGFTKDPVIEQSLDGPPSLLHKYKSRVLVIFRGGCAINCRYCFRRHFPYQEHHFGAKEREKVIAYLECHPEINEVILSGGDPLMATDHHLAEFLTEIEKIEHIKRIRIHSRLPIVIPSRLTHELAERLEHSRLQAILVLHCNHPNELSNELKTRLKKWKDKGIWLMNQSVLLKGINNSEETLVTLSEKLFEWQLLPYYLHLLDRVEGASHYDVSLQEAESLYQSMLTELPGFLVPKLVKEIGGEASKTPVSTLTPEARLVIQELLSEPTV